MKSCFWKRASNSRKDETHPGVSDDDYFLISSVDTVLRHRGLSYQQVEDGLTEGANDGGIDAVYVFLNGLPVEDDSTPASANSHLELEIIQAKNERGFKETPFQRLVDHLPVLLQLEETPEMRTEFNQRLLDRFEIFRSTFLRASGRFPNLSVRVRYVTKSVDPPNDKVNLKASRLMDKVRESFREADVDVDFVGAAELNSRARERLTTVLNLKITEGPMSADKGGLVCLISLDEWFAFITSPDGRLRDEIFEENVRGYEGSTTINKSIAESLRQGGDTSPDFWWLNNGVTVLGRRVQTSGKKLVLEDPQIVNGLQTSRTIFQSFSSNSATETNGQAGDAGDGRNLLVRVIETQDESLASQIIKATNSQNRVSVASLRATEPFQRDIEEYFSRHGLFYERKKNQYKNQGKPRGQIVEVLELAQAVAAILLYQPHTARGAPSKLVRDPEYQRVFNRQTPFGAYYNSVLVLRRIDDFLEREVSLNRQQRGNIRFHLARAATAFALSSSRPRPVAVTKLNLDSFDSRRLRPVLAWVEEARDAAEKATGSNDLNVLAKSAEWSREIDRRLSRYTSKSRWPKKTGNW